MANEENLIPLNKRTKSEQREIQRKGGIASGKVRKERADFKKKIDEVLSMEVFNPQLKEMLEEKGLSATNQSAVAVKLLQQALKGNMRAIELLAKMNSNEGTKDSLDKKEQKARIKALELENKRKAQALDEAGGGADESILIIDDIPND
jgi:phage protein